MINDIKIEILKLAANRGADKTICPSEVARSIYGENWRSEMLNIRDAAFELSSEKKIVITQKGKEVDPGNLKGPIRIRIITKNNT